MEFGTDKAACTKEASGLDASLEAGHLRGCRYLTSPQATKRTLEIAIDLRDTSIKEYLPGDAFAIACPNLSSEVEELLRLLAAEAVAGGGVVG